MSLSLQKRRDLARNKGGVVVERPINVRPEMVPRNGKHACDDRAKARIIELLRAGQTQWAMLRNNPDLPSESTIWLARQNDPEFDAAFRAAREEGQVARLEEAHEYIGSVRTDKHLAIAAEKYANVTIKIAEKLAPKTLGAMIKHADADGNKLTINVLDYKQSLEPPIDAEFKELPPLSSSTNDG